MTEKRYDTTLGNSQLGAQRHQQDSHIEKEPPVEAGEPSFETSVLTPFEFRGTGTEYFKIWIVNTILSVLTLGIYSAWAKVRRKQYLYSNTRLEGNTFQYLADPMKILKGRAIVFVLFMIYSALSSLLPIVGSILSLAFILVLPWLIVRSLTFNARNSAFRNIRFGFKGSTKEAASAYILWPFFAAITLGILFPSAYYRQKKFIVDNSTYGTTPFDFGATSKDYFRLFYRAFIPMIIGIIIVIISFLAIPPLVVLTGFVLYLYLFAYFSVKTANLLYCSVALKKHRLRADLEIKGYSILVITNSLATALTLGLFYPWAVVRSLRYKLGHIQLAAEGDLDGFIADEQKQVSAIGEEAGEFFDLDFGL